MELLMIRHKARIGGWLIILALLCMACRAAYVTGAKSAHVTHKELDSLQLEECTKLMIVAHPADESVWGGAHLADQGYFVVCLTDGSNKTLRSEFQAAIKESGNQGLILRYPNTVHGKQSKWTGDKKDIIKDLDTILTYKHWNMVVTHNPEGEYEDIQHEMTSQLVTQEYYRNYEINNLYYFGKYYKEEMLTEIQGSLRKVASSSEEIKRKLLAHYDSKKEELEEFAHTIAYEEWTQSGEIRAK